MTIVLGKDKLMSLSATGSFGYSCGFGAIRYGKTLFGFFSDYPGIYQRKKTLKGWRISRMNFYGPSNPQTPTQQAWRSVFTDGWVQYALLTPDEKALLSSEARRYRMSGPNLFMRRWLQANR